MSRISFLLALAGAALLAPRNAEAQRAAAPASPARDLPVPVRAIEIGDLRWAPYVGTTLQLTARRLLEGASAPDSAGDVYWSASDLTAASITPSGMLMLFDRGRLTITAKSGAAQAEREVEVLPNPVVGVAIRGARSAAVGDTVHLSAELTDRGGEAVRDARPSWGVVLTSEAAEVDDASIDGEGRFVAGRPGVYIVVTEMNGHAAQAAITVRAAAERVASYEAERPLPLVRLWIEAPQHAPYVGTTLALRAVARRAGGRPEDADVRVRWSSSDTSIALVGDDGIVALRKPGRVRIVAESEGVRDERSITVAHNPAARLVLRTARRDPQPGDTVQLRTDIWARGGVPVRDARVNYAVLALTEEAPAAAVVQGGRFVARRPGVYLVVAELGGLSSRAMITVHAPGMQARR
jgi:hypothetical protein